MMSSKHYASMRPGASLPPDAPGDAQQPTLGEGASASTPENKGCVPSVRPCVPVRPEAGDAQIHHFGSRERQCVPPSISGTHGRTGSDAPGLTTWLTDLKLRNLTITTGTAGPQIGGTRTDLITPTDWHQLTHHRHALELAAAGTHPTWWRWATGHHDTAPGWDDLPWTCATCGTDDIQELDPDLLAWCEVHA